MLSEGVLQKQVMETATLPLVLEIIFREGVRGNHILFDHDDVDNYSQLGCDQNSAPLALPQWSLEEIGMRLLSQPDLSGMRRMIGELAKPQRQQLYRVYCGLLSSWQSHVKTQLN